MMDADLEMEDSLFKLFFSERQSKSCSAKNYWNVLKGLNGSGQRSTSENPRCRSIGNTTVWGNSIWILARQDASPARIDVQYAILIAGVHVREKRTYSLHERPNFRPRDLINMEAHLLTPFYARVEDSLISYELENNIKLKN
jgi:hypothetical protein